MKEEQVFKSLSAECATPSKIPVHVVLVYLFITIITAAVLEFFVINHGFFNAQVNLDTSGKNNVETLFKFSIYPPVKADETHLQHVVRLLGLLGYTQTSISNLDWNLLWAHEYPFQNISQIMRSLLPHQTVNHIPGIGFLTSKVDLSTASLPFMPKAFRLPQQKEEFLKYTHVSPDILFVEKHNKHRNIKICSPKSVNLSSSETFMQEFIENPFLVDGYKFDVGVYVVITSVDPLLSYIYSGDVLFRYCSEKYLPFDPKNINKYVVGNEYLPTWEIPSLIKYFDTFGGGMRASFDAYLRDQSLDPSVIWTQVEHVVRETLFSKKNNIMMTMRPYKTGNFFELLRFDLIVDNKLKVHLMEINMSPNLSSAHFKQNSLLYEQILYSVFNLVGVGTTLRSENLSDDEIITSDKNIAVNLNDCAKYSCQKSCYKPECQMCLPCLKGSEAQILRKAHFEHLHRTDMKRIYPKAMVCAENFNIEAEVQNLSTKDAWLTRWFYEKCKDDRSWCQ